ncbi:MAG: hypothetical protein AAGI38_06895 [Bacteroidota bacterium]
MTNVKYVCILLILIPTMGHAQKMDNDALGKILQSISDTVSGQPGAWEFTVRGMPMLCLTDEANNRMRIISPVREMKDVSDEQFKAAMSANFHSALDARYAVSNGLLWSAFIHPLEELSEDQLLNAISQVYNANLTFGTSYSSTQLVFPDPEKKKQEKKKNDKRL